MVWTNELFFTGGLWDSRDSRSTSMGCETDILGKSYKGLCTSGEGIKHS
jgi:hypothetical protein